MTNCENRLLCIFEFVINKILSSGKNYCKKHPENNSCERHHAIIVCTSTSNLWHRAIKDYQYNGAKYLIKRLSKLGCPYKLYEPISCECFDSIVSNDDACILWIFGHGTINSVNIFDEKLNYDRYDTEMYKSHQKIAIYQLHCNHKSGKSLVKILSNGQGIDSGDKNGKRNQSKNLKEIKKIIKEGLPELSVKLNK